MPHYFYLALHSVFFFCHLVTPAQGTNWGSDSVKRFAVAGGETEAPAPLAFSFDIPALPRPPQRFPNASVGDLVGQLGNRYYSNRRAAYLELMSRGVPARPWLETAAKSTDPEVVERAKELLVLTGPDPIRISFETYATALKEAAVREIQNRPAMPQFMAELNWRLAVGEPNALEVLKHLQGMSKTWKELLQVRWQGQFYTSQRRALELEKEKLKKRNAPENARSLDTVEAEIEANQKESATTEARRLTLETQMGKEGREAQTLLDRFAENVLPIPLGIKLERDRIYIVPTTAENRLRVPFTVGVPEGASRVEGYPEVPVALATQTTMAVWREVTLVFTPRLRIFPKVRVARFDYEVVAQQDANAPSPQFAEMGQLLGLITSK